MSTEDNIWGQIAEGAMTNSQKALEVAIYCSYKAAYLQAKADNVALHKGIRRLSKKVKELKQQLQGAQFYAATLERSQYAPEAGEPSSQNIELEDFRSPALCEYRIAERAKIIEWLGKVSAELKRMPNGDIPELLEWDVVEKIAADIERGEHLK